jgi:hypothetical protein
MTRLATVLLLAATLYCFSGVAFASPSSPPPGWSTTESQGGSTNECNNNPGCTEISQPKGQEDKSDNNSPKLCSGPRGQCK